MAKIFKTNIDLDNNQLQNATIQSGTLGNALAAGSNKITGLANGTSSGDAVHFGQIGALGFKATIDSSALLDNEVVTEAKLSTAVQTKLNSNSAQNKLDGTTAPGATNDSSEGYTVGSFWIDVTNDEAYRLVDATEDAAVWINTTLTTSELGALALKDTIDNANLLDDSVVTNAKLAGSIADSKLSQITTADKVAGSAVQLAASSALEDSTGLTVKASGITNAMLAGSIENAKLTNSSVTITAGDGLKTGGSVSLGSSVTIDIDVSDFAGAGLEDDGSENLRLADDGVVTAKIADSNVTYAKIQDVSAQYRLLGRSSAGAGVVEEITTTSFGLSLIDDANAGAARTTLGLGTAAEAALIDDDTFATASSSNIPSAESVKAYVDANSGASSYADDFVGGDFTGSDLTVAAATHGLGATKNLIIQVYEDGTPNTSVDVAITVADNGDVTITSDSGAFAGHYVIIAA